MRPFQGLWLTAPPEVLLHSIAERRGDVSDATSIVLASQMEGAVRPQGWVAVTADAAIEEVCSEAHRALA